MQENFTNNIPNDSDHQIDLREIISALFKGKWIILSIITFASIIGIVYSLSLPNIYESKSILVPSKSSNGISGALRSYSGLAGISGLNLSSGVDDSNTDKAIKTLTSLSFFENSILKNIFLPNLMAVQRWDVKTNQLIYDDSIYNTKSNSWVRNFSYPKKQVPSAQESYRVFKNQHLSVNEDKNSGFVTISVKHQSPYIAQKWAELVISEVNSYYREKDKFESEKAVSYLNQQISMTSLSEIKQVIAELLQEETQKLTLIEANQSYVFDYIDPPVVMEQKSEPKRSLICILFAFLGGVCSIIFVLTKHYFFSKNAALVFEE